MDLNLGLIDEFTVDGDLDYMYESNNIFNDIDNDSSGSSMAYIGGTLTSPLYDHECEIILDMKRPKCVRHKNIKWFFKNQGFTKLAKHHCLDWMKCYGDIIKSYDPEVKPDYFNGLNQTLNVASTTSMIQELVTLGVSSPLIDKKVIEHRYENLKKYIMNGSMIIFEEYKMMKICEKIKDILCYKEIPHGEMYHVPGLGYFEKEVCVLKCKQHGYVLTSTNHFMCALDKHQSMFMLKLYWLLADYNKKYVLSIYERGCFLINVFEELRSQLGEDFFKVVKAWEPLTIGKIISLPDDLGFVNLYETSLMEIQELLQNIPDSESLIQKLMPLCDTDDNVRMSLELTGIMKCFGYPTLKIENLLDQIREHGSPEGLIDMSVVSQSVALAKRDFVFSYHDKHNRYPPILLTSVHVDIVKYIQKNKIPPPDVLKNLELWKDIIFEKCFEYDMSPDTSDLIKDSAAAIPRSLYMDNYDKCMYYYWYNKVPPSRPKNKKSCKRIMERYLIGDKQEVLKKINELQRMIFNTEDLIAVACSKEKEITSGGGRAYIKQTYEARLAQCSMEHNIAYTFFRYLPEQSMTDPEIKVSRRILKNVSDISESSDNINLDLTKWNLRFRHLLVHPFGLMLDQLFGLVNLYAYNHTWFLDSWLITNSRLHPPDYQPGTNEPIEGPYCIKTHKGGLEGMRQKLWTFITVSLIKLAAMKVNLNINILGQGDNQVIIIHYTKDQIAKRHELRRTLLEQLRTTFSSVHLELKESETWYSNKLHEYGKVRAYKSVPVSQSTKKCSSFIPDSTESYQTLFSPMSTINTLTESIAQKDINAEPAYFLNQFAQINYLMRKKVISSSTSHLSMCALMMFPSDFGGIPLSTYFDHVVRGHDDKVSMWISILKQIKYYNNDLYQKLLKIYQLSPSTTYISQKDKERLLEDIFCLNISTLSTMEQEVKQIALQYLSSKHVKNEEVTKLFDKNQSIDKDHLITSILSMKPLFVQLAHSLLECSNYGILLALRNKLTNISTINKMIQSKLKISYIEKMNITNAALIISIKERLGRNNISQNRSLVELSDCPTLVTDNLRRLSWKIDIVSLTRTSPYHQILIHDWDDLDEEIRKRSLFIQTSLVHANNPLIINYEKGPYPEFIGSYTHEKVKKPTLDFGEKTQYVKALKQLGTILSWMRMLGVKNIARLTEDLISEKIVNCSEDISIDNLDTWAAVSYGGCIFHRFFSTVQRSSAILNFQTSICSHFKVSTSNTCYNTSGGRDYTIFWQILMLYSIYAINRSGQIMGKLPTSTFGAVLSCDYCTREIKEVSFDIDYKTPILKSRVSSSLLPKCIVIKEHYNFETLKNLMTIYLGKKLAVYVDRAFKKEYILFDSASRPHDSGKTDVSVNDFRLVDLDTFFYHLFYYSDSLMSFLIKGNNELMSLSNNKSLAPVAQLILDSGKMFEMFSKFPGRSFEHTQVTDPTKMSTFLFSNYLKLIKNDIPRFLKTILSVRISNESKITSVSKLKRLIDLVCKSRRSSGVPLMKIRSLEKISCSLSLLDPYRVVSKILGVPCEEVNIPEDEIMIHWRNQKLPTKLAISKQLELRQQIDLERDVYPFYEFTSYNSSRMSAFLKNDLLVKIPKNISHLCRSLGVISTAISKYMEIVWMFDMHKDILNVQHAYFLAEGSAGNLTGFAVKYPHLKVGYNTWITPEIDRRVDNLQHVPPAFVSSGYLDPTRLIRPDLLSQGETNILSSRFKLKLVECFEQYPPGLITMDAESMNKGSNLEFLESYLGLFVWYKPLLIIWKMFYTCYLFATTSELVERFEFNTWYHWTFVKPISSSPSSPEIFFVATLKTSLADKQSVKDIKHHMNSYSYLSEPSKMSRESFAMYIQLTKTIHRELLLIAPLIKISYGARVFDKYSPYVEAVRGCGYFCSRLTTSMMRRIDMIHNAKGNKNVYINIRESGTNETIYDLVKVLILHFSIVYTQGNIQKVVALLKNKCLYSAENFRKSKTIICINMHLDNENALLDEIDQNKMFFRRVHQFAPCHCDMEDIYTLDFSDDNSKPEVLSMGLFNDFKLHGIIPKSVSIKRYIKVLEGNLKQGEVQYPNF